MFVLDGQLVKASSGNKLIPYRFFLFNDLLIYASVSLNKFKPHRVLQLSIARLVDVADQRDMKNAFRIVSPQKSILLIAPNAESKVKWLQALRATIEALTEKRRIYFRAFEIGSMRAGMDDEFAGGKQLRLKKYCPFIRHLAEDRRHLEGVAAAASLPPTDHKCHLCLVTYAVFRRRHTCTFCEETVCGDCIDHQVELPLWCKKRGNQNVCDACFGVLTQQVGDDVPIFSFEGPADYDISYVYGNARIMPSTSPAPLTAS
eukprot:TRINITY_DN11163_c0_g1_i9.p1 TRINITY_DN11163_c0_g1~~TRINITY_DN11163_c0_g1_i9.p1  ORF type:complete len:260 (+),score=72.16 TRINITY_DN11163_c0_g1_i9:131-910(+)